MRPIHRCTGEHPLLSPSRRARVGVGALALVLAACGDDTAGTTATDGSSGSGGPGGSPGTSAPSPDDPSIGAPTTSTTAAPTTGTDTTSTTAVDPSTDDGGTTDEPLCPNGTVLCEGDTVKVCDGEGGYKFEELCSKGCTPGYGCHICVPNASTCKDGQVMQCDETGKKQTKVYDCDPFQGMACDPVLDQCVGACVEAAKVRSNVGCDFYLAPSLYYNEHEGPQGLLGYGVANVSDEPVTTVMTFGIAGMAVSGTLQPDETETFGIGGDTLLTQGDGPSVVTTVRGHRLRTTAPITLHQLHTREPTGSADASMLLPVSAWSHRYVVAAWPSSETMPGFYTVTAALDDTTVTLSPSATGKLVQAGAGVGSDGTGVVMLKRGQTLQVVAQLDAAADLTGTIVTADKPVQVLGGHRCARIAADRGSCDHLEEAMLPSDGLAADYVVAPPQDPGKQARIVRIVASEDDTSLSFSPDQPVAKTLAKAGDFVQLGPTDAVFRVSADKKILVVQYMPTPEGSGGASMVLVVGPEHWRARHVLRAYEDWSAHVADIVAEDGAQVTLDGLPVEGWQPLAGTGFSVTRVELSAVEPSHVLDGAQNIGVSVRGAAPLTGYWYPSGWELRAPPQ